jgi:hypothetical protein
MPHQELLMIQRKDDTASGERVRITETAGRRFSVRARAFGRAYDPVPRGGWQAVVALLIRDIRIGAMLMYGPVRRPRISE